MDGKHCPTGPFGLSVQNTVSLLRVFPPEVNYILFFFKHLTNQVLGSSFWHKDEASHVYGDPTHSGISLPALTGSTGSDNANPCTSCPAKANTLYFLSYPFNACLERNRVGKVLTTYLGTSSGKVHRAQLPERRKHKANVIHYVSFLLNYSLPISYPILYRPIFPAEK